MDKIFPVVYHYNPTSNRNYAELYGSDAIVVYHYNPTSNRNPLKLHPVVFMLYIIIILHQTAT